MMTTATAATATGCGPVFVAGATGFIGRFVADAALAAGLPTYVLCRSGSTADSSYCAAAINALQQQGAIVVEGSIADKELITRILKESKIEVVLSVVGGRSIHDQLHLIDAIKTSGTVRRFLPSEFGNDVDRADPVEPGLWVYEEKRKVRRAIEEARIPYTYICCNSIAGWPYHDSHRPAEVMPPLDRFHIYGDGSTKAYFVAGCDIGRLAIRAAYDPRALNRTVHFRPHCNFLSMNELASLWERKIGRSLPVVTVTEDDLLAAAAEKRIPQSLLASFIHDVFIKGCQSRFSIDEPGDVEISELYPDTTFRTVGDCFDDFAADLLRNNEGDGNKEEMGSMEKN